MVPIPTNRPMGSRGFWKGDVLGDQENIHGAEVKVVKIGHRRQSLATSVHASVELSTVS